MRQIVILVCVLALSAPPGDGDLMRSCRVAFGETADPAGDKAFSVAAVLVHEEALDRPHDVELQGSLAFVPGKGGSIAIIDVGDPANPKILWHRHDARRLSDAETVLPLGDYPLLGTNDLISIDVRDPRDPR